MKNKLTDLQNHLFEMRKRFEEVKKNENET
jgi:hypothetical protein